MMLIDQPCVDFQRCDVCLCWIIYDEQGSLRWFGQKKVQCSAFFHVCLVEAAIFCSAVFFGSRIENKNCVANSCRFGFRESLGVDSSKTFLESLKVSFPRRILVLLPLSRDREYTYHVEQRELTNHYHPEWGSEERSAYRRITYLVTQ